jgi:hypothetical protein
VGLGQADQRGVAVGVGADRDPGQHPAGADIEDRSGMSVGVGVDTDDDLDEFCQHGHGVLSF